MQMPWESRVKVEPLNPIHADLSESSDDNVVFVSKAIGKLSPILEFDENTILVMNEDVDGSTLPSLDTKNSTQVHSVF